MCACALLIYGIAAGGVVTYTPDTPVLSNTTFQLAVSLDSARAGRVRNATVVVYLLFKALEGWGHTSRVR